MLTKQTKTNHAIRWIVIYPVDSVIQPLNNPGQEYKIRDREVKRSVGKDKRNFIKKLASEAEEAAEKRDFGIVYKITKQLCGNNTNHKMRVKDKQGKVITTEREQAARWVQHFEEVLNRPDPEEPADPPPSESYLDIDYSPPPPHPPRPQA